MERPPIAYRNVVLAGGRVSAEYTTTEPLEVFPHGEWSRIDQRVDEWWVRLALSDPWTREVIAGILGGDRDGGLMELFRSAEPERRRVVFAVAREATGVLLPASLLEVSPAELDDAADELYP